MDSMSSGLSQRKVPLGPASTGTPSTTYRGSWERRKDFGPLMRTEIPPPGGAVTVAPETRPASICASDPTGGGALSDATVDARPWAHAVMSATSRTPDGDEVMEPPFPHNIPLIQVIGDTH